MERTAADVGFPLTAMPGPKSLSGWAALAVLTGCGGPSEEPTSIAGNATYAGILDEPVTLVSGSYRGVPYVEGGASRPVVQLLEGPVASGDIDGDGADELIVVLVANMGGSGAYIYLAIVDAGDGPARPARTTMLGDRIVVRSIAVSNGVVSAETTEHSPGDPMCCPTQQRQRTWRFGDGELIEQAGGPMGETPDDGGLSTFRGQVVLGHEARSFVECDSGREGWIIDGTGGDLGSDYESLASEAYQPIFFELNGAWRAPPASGFGADFDEALEVVGVVRAEREGFGCRLDPATFAYRAMGNEPGWRLDVLSGRMGFSRMGEDAIESDISGVTLAAGEIRMTGGTGDRHVEARFEKGRCTDSMSGSIFSWSASVVHDGDRYTGCAVEGSLPLNEVEGEPD